MDNNVTWAEIPKSGIIEEGYEQDSVIPHQCIIQTRPYFARAGLTLLACIIYMTVSMLHRTGWHTPTGKNLFILLFVYILYVISLMIGLPQRLYITHGSATCTLMIGYRWLCIRYTLPFSYIAGLTLTSTNAKHIGHVPQLSLEWRIRWVPIRIGTYVENDIALKRAEYISEQTGIPIVKVAMDPVIRRRKA